MTVKEFIKRYSNIIFFVGGFLIDSVTLTRIDSILDLVWEACYLLVITALILAQEKVKRGLWTPSGFLGRFWHYESEALHFCYGGLLSAYVIFYFRSTSLSRSVFFFGLVVVLMFANEMPQIRRFGSTMRLGLYAFCLVSFFNYLFPVVLGQMGWWVFLLALVASAGLTWLLIRRLDQLDGQEDSLAKLSASPAVVLLLVAIFYFNKWIPPVPLSLKYAGIYHNIERENSNFRLTYQKPPWYRFWQKQDRVFVAQSGDRLFCFVSVFGPRRFNHQIYLHWQKKNDATGKWQSSDRVPLSIQGGRGEGFRGYAVKENYEPGKWRVEVETEDGRVLGAADFSVQLDAGLEAREFRSRSM